MLNSSETSKIVNLENYFEENYEVINLEHGIRAFSRYDLVGIYNSMTGDTKTVDEIKNNFEIKNTTMKSTAEINGVLWRDSFNGLLNPNLSYFLGKCAHGYQDSWYMWGVGSGNFVDYRWGYNDNVTAGVRIVLWCKAGVEIIGGDGSTLANAYQVRLVQN